MSDDESIDYSFNPFYQAFDPDKLLPLREQQSLESFISPAFTTVSTEPVEQFSSIEELVEDFKKVSFHPSVKQPFTMSGVTSKQLKMP